MAFEWPLASLDRVVSDLAAMPDQELAECVCAFLAAALVPEILADRPNEFALLRRHLAKASSPTERKPIRVERSDVCVHLASYIDRHPNRLRFRHHAAVDAVALRCVSACVKERAG